MTTEPGSPSRPPSSTDAVGLHMGAPSKPGDLYRFRHERTLAFLDARPMLDGIAAGRYAAVTTFGPVASPRDDGHLPGLSAALARACGPPLLYGHNALYLRKRPPCQAALGWASWTRSARMASAPCA